jgi:uncharacterized protein
MPLFAFYAKDGPNGPALRDAHRVAHLENMTRINAAGRMVFAGPLKDNAGRSIGALIIFEANDESAARAEMESDPYTRGGVYEHYEITPVVKAFPKKAANSA